MLKLYRTLVQSSLASLQVAGAAGSSNPNVQSPSTLGQSGSDAYVQLLSTMALSGIGTAEDQRAMVELQEMFESVGISCSEGIIRPEQQRSVMMKVRTIINCCLRVRSELL
jgi:hypothetical protein